MADRCPIPYSFYHQRSQKFPTNLENKKLMRKEYDANKHCFGAYRADKELPVNNYPIEKITHHIWVKAHQDVGKNGKDKEINDEDLTSLLDQFAKIDASLNEFRHIIWTNDIKLIPNTMTKLKDISNIEVREISSLKSEIENINVIEQLIEDGVYGATVDALKYQVVRIFGGIVFDLNYHFYTDNLNNFLNSYNFFAQVILGGGSVQVENSLIAANKGHVILNDICEKVDMNLQYIKENGYPSSCSQSDLVDFISYDQWSESVASKININDTGSIDELFAHWFCEVRDENNEVIMNGLKNILGHDEHSGSWGF